MIAYFYSVSSKSHHMNDIPFDPFVALGFVLAGACVCFSISTHFGR